MDPQSQSFTPIPSANETWRLQTDFARMQQLQGEHAERIARLERRQDDDARMKSVWGPSSPFPNVLGGTPQQVPQQHPAADQFRNFDDEANNMISSLHLDADDEPRRGLGANSRANSVRFDETANQNHFSHSSRPSGEFMSRNSNGFGGLQLGERAMSHKSDGRASSQHSLRSAASGRANSLNMDSTYGNGDSNRSPLDTPGLAPGLSLLGGVPAIIRCWMNTNFKHDALLYAAVCSGSYKSFLDLRLIQKLGFEAVIRAGDNGIRTVELPVFFPEAVPLSSSSRSSSPAPHLPSLVIEFRVCETAPDNEDSQAVQIFIGSDVLRAHNADILFSSNSITIYDDERSKLSIPLARPENEAAFNSLFVASGLSQPATRNEREVAEPMKAQPYLNGLGQENAVELQPSSDSPLPARYRPPGAIAAESGIVTDSAKPATTTSSEYNTTRPTSQQSIASRPSLSLLNTVRPETSQDARGLDNESSTSQQHSNSLRTGSSPAIWNNWRRDGSAAPSTQPSTGTLDWGAVASKTRDPTAFLPRRDASSGIKVLKPKTTSSATRAFSTSGTSSALATGSNSPATEGKTSRFFEEGRRRSAAPSEEAKSTVSDAKKDNVPASATTPKTKTNPIGGASAFSWLNSGGGGGGGSK